MERKDNEKDRGLLKMMANRKTIKSHVFTVLCQPWTMWAVDYPDLTRASYTLRNKCEE